MPISEQHWIDAIVHMPHFLIFPYPRAAQNSPKRPSNHAIHKQHKNMIFWWDCHFNVTRDPSLYHSGPVSIQKALFMNSRKKLPFTSSTKSGYLTNPPTINSTYSLASQNTYLLFINIAKSWQVLGLYNILDRYSRYLRTSTYIQK